MTAASLTARFAAAMAPLGPFEPEPVLAAAVSGGADSMALTLLAHDWAAAQGGRVLALTVDHGLRASSAAEADLTLTRLAGHGIQGRKLTLNSVHHGPALAERARAARYAALTAACASEGIVHLLLGHHRSDQVETLAMRVLSGSGRRGLAAMAALTENGSLRLLRPLLGTAPGCLRAFMRDRGTAWVEDPSNQDPSAQRARLRLGFADPEGTGEATSAIAGAICDAGHGRAARDRVIARVLSTRAALFPEGYAVVTPGPIDPEALAALFRTIAGADHAPPPDRIAALARALGPVTLGGVRLMPAGRLGPGWLLTREPRAMAPPVLARPGAVWDGRFRVTAVAEDGCDIGALGLDSAQVRDGRLPAAVLHGLPALRRGGTLIAVPHIGVGASAWRTQFHPRNPAAGAPFVAG